MFFFNHIKHKSSWIFLIQRRYINSVKHKKFYKQVTVNSINNKYEINLDGKKLKTPLGNIFYVNSKPLALAIANEWDSQKDYINLNNMHLTTLTNTAIDNPLHNNTGSIINNMFNYFESDTLCFRINDHTDELSSLQDEKWNPIIKWFEHHYHCHIPVTNSVVLSNMSHDTRSKIHKHLSSHNSWALLGLLFTTENLKSLILTLALSQKRITTDLAVSLSRLEEEFQIKRWGNVEWAHDIDHQMIRSRVSAGMMFYFFNSESSQTVKKFNSK